MSGDLTTLTTIHTALSFIAMGLGIPAILSLLGNKVAPLWTMLFLEMAMATTITGFLFPFIGFTPAIVVGVIALVTLCMVFAARYAFRNEGLWRLVYTAGIVLNVYLLFFVAIAQAFTKIPFFYDLAPTLSEPPFAIAQIVTLSVFAVIGYKVLKITRLASIIPA